MRVREALLNTLLISACLSSVVTAAVVVRRQIATPTAGGPNSPTPPRPIDNWKDYVEGGRRIGPDNAALTIVEFADFQCPACRGFHAVIERLRAEYPNDFAVSYRYFPLSYHRRAYASARASECAAQQGRFEAFHRALFDSFDSLDTVSFEPLARKAGVSDIARFNSCASSSDPVPRIERDLAIGRDSLRLTGTPTVLANGKMYVPAPLPSELKRMIEDARKSRSR